MCVCVRERERERESLYVHGRMRAGWCVGVHLFLIVCVVEVVNGPVTQGFCKRMGTKICLPESGSEAVSGESG